MADLYQATAQEGRAGPKQTARNHIALFSLNPFKPRVKLRKQESAAGTTLGGF